LHFHALTLSTNNDFLIRENENIDEEVEKAR
jgi:hypothetical protein